MWLGQPNPSFLAIAGGAWSWVPTLQFCNLLISFRVRCSYQTTSFPIIAPGSLPILVEGVSSVWRLWERSCLHARWAHDGLALTRLRVPGSPHVVFRTAGPAKPNQASSWKSAPEGACSWRPVCSCVCLREVQRWQGHGDALPAVPLVGAHIHRSLLPSPPQVFLGR